MILASDGDGQVKQLSPDELAEVRDCWGMGVPLRTLATPHGIDETELRRQLGGHARRAIAEPPAEQRGLIGLEHVRQMTERKRQLEALRERFGGRLDG